MPSEFDYDYGRQRTGESYEAKRARKQRESWERLKAAARARALRAAARTSG